MMDELDMTNAESAAGLPPEAPAVDAASPVAQPAATDVAAEQTPLRSGEKPSQSFRQARAVANPTPAGNPRNHQRSRHAYLHAKAAASSP